MYRVHNIFVKKKFQFSTFIYIYIYIYTLRANNKTHIGEIDIVVGKKMLLCQSKM